MAIEGGTTIQRVAAIGHETTWGTPVARTVKLMQVTAPPTLTPDVAVTRTRSQGSFAPATTSRVPRAGASGSLEFRPTVEDLPLWLQSAFGPINPSPNSSPYPRQYDAPLSTKPTPWPYTLEGGDPGNVYLLAGVIPTQIVVGGDFDANDGELTATVDFLANKKTPVAATNEVQTLTVTGSPTGGTYKLYFRGYETSALAFDANAAAIQTALRALASITATGVTVTGTGPFTLTFSGAPLSNEDIQLLILSDNSLTGGTSPSVTIVETTKGGGQTALVDREVEKLGIDGTRIYVDALGGTIGTTEVTAALVAWRLTLTTGYHAKSFAGSPFAQRYGWGEWDAMLTTRFEFTSAVKTWVDSIVEGTKIERLLRLDQDASGSNGILIDGGYTLQAPPDVTDREGNSVVELTWGAINPVAAGYWHRWKVSNGLATLAA